MTDFTYDLDADGVATITWDVPGRSMNVMSMEGFAELEALIDRGLAEARGIVLTSGKKDFAGGMDLNILARMQEGGTEGVFKGIMETHRFLRKIERAGMDPKTLKGGKPIVCAMPGTGLGIGFEIPLACHRIIAADNPKAKIGLPEILVGIFPGAGGTTRLIRKMGVMMAAPFLMEGKLLEPRLAKAEGLIDEVVPADQLLSRAKEWVLSAKEADIVKPWDQKGYKLPGGAPYHPSGFQTFVGANAMILGKTQGVYPAAKALLQAAYEGTMASFDTALRVEARAFTGVLMDPTSSAMIRSLFINKEALEKGARRPALPDESVKVLGVIGAGMMGAGIAHVAASAGIEVVLIDATQEAADKGKAHSEGLLDKQVQRRKMSAEKKAEVLSRITATTDYAALGSADLVVEAVFEDPKVKAEVTARIEAAIPASCIVATNTSTLPSISGLAKASQRPGQYIGIHFFSPVDKMALVEIIRGKATEDRAVAKALDFVRALRKTPIVVNDARFFYANRCIIPYINEGLRMVAEGVPPALIENAAKLLGMPLGPLQLVDETSIDLGVKIAKATKAAMGDSYPDGAVDEVLFKMADLGRMGRKAKAGFYAYDETGKRLDLWEGLADLWPVTQTPDLVTVQHRLLMIQALEAVRAKDADVLTDIREGDVGAILGWGFAPWSGGPFSWLDRIGAAKAVEVCDSLTALGPRFAAPQSLRDMAAQASRFYQAA